MGERCYGCGRLLGLRTPLECMCWRSVLHGAKVPHRLVSFSKRVTTVLHLASIAQSPSEESSVRAMACSLNASLRAA